MLKRLTALFCVLTLILSICTMPVFAEDTEITLAADTSVVTTVTNVGAQHMVKPTTTTNILWDNFEDGDASDWYLRNNTNEDGRKAEILEENGNKFLRFSLTDGAYPSNFNKANELSPILSRSFKNDGAIKVDMNNISVFEMDVRTGAIDADVSKILLLNYPYPTEKMPDGTAYSRDNSGLSEIGWNSRNFFTLASNSGKVNTSVSAYWANSSTPYSGGVNFGTMTANSWYKVRYVFNNMVSPRTLSAYIYDSNEALVGYVEDQELTAWWYNYYDLGTYTQNGNVFNSKFPIGVNDHMIYDLSFRLAGPAYSVNDNMTQAEKDAVIASKKRSANIDIDNLRYYSQKPEVNASMKETILFKTNEAKVYFDAPVNYTENGIEVYNSNGVKIPHEGTYDDANRVYTATFDSELPSGNYKFMITDAVAPLNASEGKVASITLLNRELNFKAYDTMPPYVEDVKIEGVVKRGQTISASYEFFTETGNESGSVHEWYFSATGDEGSFTLIEGADTKSISIDDYALSGKYLQYAVTPKADNGLEGNKVYSNILEPAEDVLTISEITNTGADFMIKPENTTDMLWDNFEDGNASNWYFRNANNAAGRKAEVLDENGNKFLRFSLLNGDFEVSYNNANEMQARLSRNFADNGAVKIDMENISVFEMNIRTSSIEEFAAKVIQVNNPYPTDTMPDGKPYARDNSAISEHGWNTRQLLHLAKNKANLSAGNHGGDNAMQGTTKEIGTLSPKEWYKIRYVYNNTAEPKTVSAYIYDAEGTLVSSSTDVPMTAWWLTHYDIQKKFPITQPEIYDITLAFFTKFEHKEVSTNFDIDDIRIFTQKSLVETKVSSNTDIGVLFKPTEVSFTFDAPIEYTEGGLTIKDASRNIVDHTGVYDEKTRTYKANFGRVLPEGNYSFVIEDSITPVNATEGKISAIDFVSRDINFFSYETMPPSAQNVKIDGRVINGTKIDASYKFITQTGAEENSVHEWYKSDSGEPNTFTLIEGANTKTLDVTEAGVFGKYIQYSVTPRSDNGYVGVRYYSNVIAPEAKPYIEDIKLSTNQLFVNKYISPVYNYFDDNNDPENGTEYELYKSSDGVSGWTLISTEGKYLITAEDEGCYFRYKVTPKNKAVVYPDGDTYETAVVGPVNGDLLETTNLLVDPGFETTKVGEYWKFGASEGVWKGISITNEAARSGQYSLRQPPRASVHDTWGQDVEITEGNVYINGGYAKKSNDKLPDTGSLWPYCTGGGVSRYDKVTPDYTVTKRWQLCVGTWLATTTKAVRFQFVSFEQISSLDALFDDMYVGELLVDDIETFEAGDVSIPQFGETAVTITSGKILNQLGTTHGLVDETIKYDTAGAEGVSIKDGKLVVTNRAKAGRINVRLYVEPQYPGANQSVFEKYVAVNLIPNNDTTPKAFDVKAVGDVAEGSTLTGSYKFYQIEDKADASTFMWTYCDTEDGTYNPIPGANSITYTVESAYANKYIKFAVIPKTNDGVTGSVVYSNYLTIPRVPVASNVEIDGDFNVGGTITATYRYYDPNGDKEGTSIYRWMIADTIDSNYRPVSGQNSNTLTLTESMVGKYIKVGVTPVSQIAPVKGVEVWSNSVEGPAKPTALYVEIDNNNGRLTGKYVYSHSHNIQEKGTTYKWTVDGVIVSTNIDYVPNFNGRKTVTFTVTPKADGNPSLGNSVSVSVVIGNSEGSVPGGFGGGGSSSGGTGGGGGGGGASSGSGTGITNINDMNRVDPNKEPEKQPETPKSDIDNHWGKSYIEEMSKRGVMTADENGNFNPDVNVTREEMLTFLFDALGLEESEYSNQFGDVADGDFAKKLQTMVNNGTIAKDVNFRPNDTISREEMCKILYVSLKNAGKLAEVEDGLINTFADFNGISDWAKVYVNAIYGNKIMVGVSDTEFDAQGTVTKAQAATMLVRILNLTEGE